jgi:hypothetical protein
MLPVPVLMRPTYSCSHPVGKPTTCGCKLDVKRQERLPLRVRRGLGLRPLARLRGSPGRMPSWFQPIIGDVGIGFRSSHAQML